MIRRTSFLLFSALATSSCTAQKLDRSCFVPTFSEEFDKPLSRWSEARTDERWRTRYFHSGLWPLGRGLGQNSGESQIYVDPEYLGLGLMPFEIKNGVLTIRARPASLATRKAVASVQQPGGPQPRFTSGLLTTEQSWLQRYGYFEARIKIPSTMGAWPAFWLYEDSAEPHAEIDIMEAVSGEPGTHYVSVHGYTTKVIKRTFASKTRPLDQDFHLYGALWTPSDIIFYRDDVEVARTANPNIHRPMYMLLNVAMDGSWNASRKFRAADNARADMKVDYVRAYSLRPDC